MSKRAAPRHAPAPGSSAPHEALSRRDRDGTPLDYLDSFQFHGFRLGLERMTAILHAMEDPHLSYPCVHVAGTNGKGSVCAILTSVLDAAGYRVGLYTSPHLLSVRERCRCGGMIIPEAELDVLILRIRRLVEKGFELSYFEYTTALAMAWFAEKQVDIAVLETGLGGRLDATNVVTPLVSVITNVSLEHQAYLGNTVEEIAAEKAGIIKPGIPCISGVAAGPARAVIRRSCLERSSPLWELGSDMTARERPGGRLDYAGPVLAVSNVALALRGRHQVDNCGLALAGCERLLQSGFAVTETALRAGCASVAWPGRGELLRGDCLALLDGAHNPHGVKSLLDLLGRIREGGGPCPGRWTLLWACSDEGGDKDFSGMLSALAPFFGRVIITEPPGPRRPVTVDRWKERGILREAALVRSWTTALDVALDLCGKDDLLCVSGSLYLVGPVREKLLRRGYSADREFAAVQTSAGIELGGERFRGTRPLGEKGGCA